MDTNGAVTDPRIALELAAARAHHLAGREAEARDCERRAKQLMLNRDRSKFRKVDPVWLGLNVEVEGVE